MNEGTGVMVHTSRLSNGDDERSADGIYPAHSPQSAGLWQRLRQRRLTSRALLAYAAAAFVLVLGEPAPVTFAIGTGLCALGLALRIWTFGHLRKNLALVTTGPYAHTRNPAYLGSALVLVGLFLAAGNPYGPIGIGVWAVGVVALAVFFLRYLPRKFSREYGQLERLFPHEIERHAAHVPSFWPRPTPWRSGDNHRFSWACVLANHELVWAPACALALALMWVG